MKQRLCVVCGRFVTERDDGKHFCRHLLEVAALVLVAVIVAMIWQLR